MARDVVFDLQPTGTSLARVWETGKIENISSSPASSNWRQRSQRSDVIKSDHSTPTPYSAFMYQSTPLLVGHRYGPAYNGVYLEGSQYIHSKYCFRRTGSLPLKIAGTGMEDCSGNVPYEVIAAATNLALNRCADSSVNLGQFLGEFPQTVRMMLSHTITFLQAFRALRRGQFAAIPRILGIRRLDKLPKYPVDIWFAYKFGWLPFLTDLYNMHSAVQEQLARPQHQSVKAVITTNHTYCHDKLAAYTSFDIGDNTKGCEVGISFVISSESKAVLTALGLTNPVSVAWELVPLSFVLDWFIPIGSFLSAASATVGLDFKSGYRTTFAKGVFTVKENYTGFPYAAPPWQSTAVAPPMEATITGRGMIRSVLAGWPLPRLYVKFDLNSSQVATALGLLLQRM